MTAFSKMYYPKLTFASSTIEGIFLFGILCLSNKIYGLDPKISLEVSKSCMWEKPRFASEQHPLCKKSCDNISDVHYFPCAEGSNGILL